MGSSGEVVFVEQAFAAIRIDYCFRTKQGDAPSDSAE